MALSDYKDALGKPREGIHALRIPYLDIAFWDVVGTIVISGGIAYYFDKSQTNVVSWIIIAFALGFFFHHVFGVRTKLTVAAGL